MKLDDERFAAMGRAAYLPGMIFIVEQMQNLVDDFRRQVELLQAGETTPKKKGRPAGPPKPEGKKKRSSGWPADPEARKREMARRLALGRRRKKAREQAKPKMRMLKEIA